MITQLHQQDVLAVAQIGVAGGAPEPYGPQQQAEPGGDGQPRRRGHRPQRGLERGGGVGLGVLGDLAGGAEALEGDLVVEGDAFGAHRCLAGRAGPLK